MDRNERNLEIVRQTAEILSSGSTLSETFERFCLMLAEFIDASVVFIAIKRSDGVFIDFEYDHGESAHPRRRINPESQTHIVIESGQPIFIQKLEELRGPLIPLKEDDDSHSAMFVPLRFGAETVGVLSVQTTQEFAYTVEDLRLIETCALYAAVSVQAESVRNEKEILQSVATRDALTGVGNRRAFDQRLKEDWARAHREDGTMSILVLDVDWFKRFNDTYGHVAGDACLNQVAQAAQSCVIRESDLFARYGGEEFIAILWATDAAGAKVVAERILHAVRTLGVPHAESPLGRVTASIGIATAGKGGRPGALRRQDCRPRPARGRRARRRLARDAPAHRTQQHSHAGNDAAGPQPRSRNDGRLAQAQPDRYHYRSGRPG
jgi:diguanylate cyclase (GGDEF)-like protein